MRLNANRLAFAQTADGARDSGLAGRLIRPLNSDHSSGEISSLTAAGERALVGAGVERRLSSVRDPANRQIVLDA
jgi:hypothetical protein